MTSRVLGIVALLSLLALVYVVRSPSSSAVVVVPTSTPVTTAHPVGDTAALAACEGKMGSERLIGAFTSTAGAIADWIANAAYPDAPQLRQSEWRSLPPTSTAYLCYFSGAFVLPGGPPGPVGSGPQPTEPLADRALIFIDASGKQIGPSKYGLSALIPIVHPGGRW